MAIVTITVTPRVYLPPSSSQSVIGPWKGKECFRYQITKRGANLLSRLLSIFYHKGAPKVLTGSFLGVARKYNDKFMTSVNVRVGSNGVYKHSERNYLRVTRGEARYHPAAFTGCG